MNVLPPKKRLVGVCSESLLAVEDGSLPVPEGLQDARLILQSDAAVTSLCGAVRVRRCVSTRSERSVGTSPVKGERGGRQAGGAWGEGLPVEWHGVTASATSGASGASGVTNSPRVSLAPVPAA